MKATRKSITDYDTVLSIAISTLQCHLACMENTLLDDDESDSSDNESVVNDSSVKYKKGDMFDKVSPFTGGLQVKSFASPQMQRTTNISDAI